MQSLKPTEVRSIEQFFQLKQENLLKVMNKFLKTKYETVYSTKDYLIAVGDIPVALVAHLDTVFPKTPENIYYDRVKNVMWSPEGLGADDRAGVYSIVQILKQGLKPTIIFTTEEETGATGAREIINDFPEAPMELKYMIELDRRGSIDCVFYDCNNPKFEEYVEGFGFVTAWGTFSDISVICPAWGVAGVNLSIGYEDEHSFSETLHIGHMKATIKKVVNMLNDINSIVEKFEYIPAEYNRFFTRFLHPTEDDFGWDPSYGISKELWDSWHFDTPTSQCAACGIKDFDYNLFPVKGLDSKSMFLCADCISKDPSIQWCVECGEPYVSAVEDKIERLCYDCRIKMEENNK